MIKSILGWLFFIAGFLTMLMSMFGVASAPQGTQAGVFALNCFVIVIILRLDKLISK